MHQRGIAPLALLFLVTLGIFVLWEVNEYTNSFSNIINPANPGNQAAKICIEENNCNDSNDVFLLPE